MTDGIIQQAFKQLKEYANKHYKDTAFITLTEQELIEKIKQEIPAFGSDLSRYTIYKILLGDNQ